MEHDYSTVLWHAQLLGSGVRERFTTDEQTGAPRPGPPARRPGREGGGAPVSSRLPAAVAQPVISGTQSTCRSGKSASMCAKSDTTPLLGLPTAPAGWLSGSATHHWPWNRTNRGDCGRKLSVLGRFRTLKNGRRKHDQIRKVASRAHKLMSHLSNRSCTAVFVNHRYTFRWRWRWWRRCFDA